MVTIGESLPGTLSFSDISAAATSESEKQLRLVQKSLDMDDPINIQFTSVKVQCFIFFYLSKGH